MAYRIAVVFVFWCCACWGEVLRVSTRTAEGFDVGRTELFLDSSRIASSSGVTQSIDKMYAHPSSPVTAAKIWDHASGNPQVYRNGTDWRMYYMAVPDDFHAATNITVLNGYWTSTNGLDWVAPVVGEYSYNGSTSNNVVVTNMSLGRSTPGSINYDETRSTGLRWLFLDNHHEIHQSSNGVTFSLNQTIPTPGWYPSFLHTWDWQQRDSGKWMIFTQIIPDETATRGVSAMMSATTSITSSYNVVGGSLAGLSGTSTNAQCYRIGVHVHKGNWIGFVQDYNKSTETIHMDLYYSRDGWTWVQVYDEWIPLGTPGGNDDAQIQTGSALVKNGDDWWYYYAGIGALHGSNGPYPSDVYLITNGYERIGSIAGTGTFTTTTTRPTGNMTINTDASGGSVTVAVLNPTTLEPLPGYEHGAFDAITSDVYEQAATWGGKQIMFGRDVALEFSVTSATVYSYSVGAE